MFFYCCRLSSTRLKPWAFPSEFCKIPKSEIEKIFENYRLNSSYLTYCSYKSTMLSFLDFYEKTFETLPDKTVKQYLSDIDKNKIAMCQENNKTSEVPVDYFPIFLKGIKSIMRNEKEDMESRKIAAVIILFSQIGFRCGEMMTVEADSVKSVWSPNKEKPLYYMEYKSYKHGIGDNGYTIGRTYINELSYEAYSLLMEACNADGKRLEINNLYIPKNQVSKSCNHFNRIYRRFILKHWKELQCLNIGDKYEDLECMVVGKLGKKEMKAAKKASLKDTDEVYYPTLRQFRVSVCTSLYRQQVPLYYIKKHMNHLSEDMAAYYIRPQKNLEKEYSEAIYRAVFEDGSKILGKNGDAFIQRIEEFIEKNNLNIKDNPEDVISTLVKKFPLRSKVGGMCIRCGEVIPCASNNSTDVIYCAFGMCPNHCHMFFMADISYEEYLQHKDIVQYNKDNGFKKAYQKELNKLRYIIENSLMPELMMLEEELTRHCKENILAKYPQLTYIVNNFEPIKKEVSSWIQEKE